MTESSIDTAVDYSASLYLPKTDFPMRAGLPKKEPEIIAHWDRLNIYKRQRALSKGREKFVLHDGPPYANGHLHIGHALNKILKDAISRSFQMMGYDSNYVPGWDCHGLPIEWKIEEQYRAKGKNKDDVPVNEFRRQCREFAANWVKIQSEEFRRFGVEGDFENPYLTMDFRAEAHIARELMSFATSGQLYRGSKPVMWSVVERTALAEAEIEYHTYESDAVWVKFPVVDQSSDGAGRSTHVNPAVEQEVQQLVEQQASVVIWTTTPWTIPANRAISFAVDIEYGLYQVSTAENDFGPKSGETFIVADSLASGCADKAKLTFNRLATVSSDALAAATCRHPLAGFAGGYDFAVPMFTGDHVTEEAGTGFVHTAPGHGRDDFEIWMSHQAMLTSRGIDASIPFCVGGDGYYTEAAPGFGPDSDEGAARVIDDKGKKGDANNRVIAALIAADMLFARGRVKHDYPHSWRSKKPVIFRNTPQWFVFMDKPLNGEILTETQVPVILDAANDTLRSRALNAIDATRFVPPSGQRRLWSMLEQRPDWVLSRQRAWGVPICVFVDADGAVLKDDAVNQRIFDTFCQEGADAWFAEGAAARFLGDQHDPSAWEMVTDILDVWFDSGSTHAFCLEQRDDLKWPADVYIEGTDQHRGWFHSSLLESCGTRGRAPYDCVITHGFTTDDQGRKMSKSLGNQTQPEEIIKQYGADILRLWVMTCDYAEDLRIGPEILKTNVDAYRRLRNTLRWMLGTLNHYQGEVFEPHDLPELERYMLHQLAALQPVVEQGYRDFDFKRVFSAIFNFMNGDMSSFYFDIRKDALYCDAPSSIRRRAALYVVDRLFHTTIGWLGPMLPFTMEEAWLNRTGDQDGSIHLTDLVKPSSDWLDQELADKWQAIRRVRRVVTGALELERAEKRVRSSLEAAPQIYIADTDLLATAQSVDFADVCITSQVELIAGAPPENAFQLDEVAGVGVVPTLSTGTKCARSWKILPEVGTDPDYPDLTIRDADAMRELVATGVWPPTQEG